jgi:hypothetical protein
MANPSVTYTFTNSTTADGTQVSQNFTDLINSMTDGTKSFSIDALTVAGAALFNGDVTLGNASSDVITVNGNTTFSGTVTIGTKAISNPMDSAGDMIVGGASGAITKLDSGVAGAILAANGAASPIWKTTTSIDSSGGILSYVPSANAAANAGSLAGHKNAGGITLAAGQYTEITVNDSYCWLVTTNSGSGQGGVFVMQHSSTTVSALNNADSYAVTDTGAHIALYKASPSFAFTVKNRSALSQQIKVTVIGANVSSVSNPA